MGSLSLNPWLLSIMKVVVGECIIESPQAVPGPLHQVVHRSKLWQPRFRAAPESGTAAASTGVLHCAGCATYTTLRKQALVTDLRLRHRDIRALDPGVALPCKGYGRAFPFLATLCKVQLVLSYSHHT